MALAVVGNVDVEQVLSVCDKMLKSAPNLSIERSFEKEDWMLQAIIQNITLQ